MQSAPTYWSRPYWTTPLTSIFSPVWMSKKLITNTSTWKMNMQEKSEHDCSLRNMLLSYNSCIHCEQNVHGELCSLSADLARDSWCERAIAGHLHCRVPDGRGRRQLLKPGLLACEFVVAAINSQCQQAWRMRLECLVYLSENVCYSYKKSIALGRLLLYRFKVCVLIQVTLVKWLTATVNGDIIFNTFAAQCSELSHRRPTLIPSDRLIMHVFDPVRSMISTWELHWSASCCDFFILFTGY